MKNIGIIGCGNIAPAYINGIRKFSNIELKAVSNRTMDSARRCALEFGVPAVSVEDLLLDKDIDIVVNLTVPNVHAQISRQIIDAGKHVYSEKPLAVSYSEGRKLMDYAARKKLYIGCAPDTFLGAGHQTCRKLIDDGSIGTVKSGTAFMLSSGPESWHPSPHFFYKKGAGPMFDMGPYYLTSLIDFLGPVKEVAATVSKAFAERTATCREYCGEKLPVEVPTHYSGVLIFENGAHITFTISFDVPAHTHSHIELYGTDGSLLIPDPNIFGGEVRLFRREEAEWTEADYTHGYSENSRGFGVADMAAGIEKGTPFRASGEMALHVLEIMEAFEKSQKSARRISLRSSCIRPQPLPVNH